jgi:hypothetical protein
MYSTTLKLLVLATTCFLASSQYFVRPLRQLSQPGPYGADKKGYTDYFNDYTSNTVGIKSIVISYSDQVDSIQVTYLLANKSLYQAPRHGSIKNTNPPVEIKLRSGEYLYKIEGQTSGVNVDQLTLITRRPKDSAITIYGPFGRSGTKMNFTIEGYILWFYGYADDALDSIGVYLYPAPKSAIFGYNDQTPQFDENPDTSYSSPVVKINKLFIQHENMVYSIQAQYLLVDGTTRLGGKLGWPVRGDVTVVKFEDDEEILGIEGTSTSGRLCQLSLISKRDNLSTPLLYNGPFGWPCTAPSSSFKVEGKVLGLFGFVNHGIAGLGIYYS